MLKGSLTASLHTLLDPAIPTPNTTPATVALQAQPSPQPEPAPEAEQASPPPQPAEDPRLMDIDDNSTYTRRSSSIGDIQQSDLEEDSVVGGTSPTRLPHTANRPMTVLQENSRNQRERQRLERRRNATGERGTCRNFRIIKESQKLGLKWDTQEAHITFHDGLPVLELGETWTLEEKLLPNRAMREGLPTEGLSIADRDIVLIAYRRLYVVLSG
jgi:hypothetical protein